MKSAALPWFLLFALAALGAYYYPVLRFAWRHRREIDAANDAIKDLESLGVSL